MSTEEALRGQIKDWLEMMKACHAHLTEFYGRPYTEPKGNTVQMTWLRKLAELNEEKLDGHSLTDMLYVIRCYLIVFKSRLAEPSLQDMYSFFHEIRLIGAHHAAYPTPQQIAKLEEKAAVFVVWVLADKYDSLLATLPAKPTLPDALAQRVNRARCVDFKPPVAEALADGTLPTRNDDIQPGTWWVPGRECMVHSFVVTCSRVFHKLQWDEWVVSQLHMRIDSAYDEVTAIHNRTMLHEWVLDRAGMELPNELLLLYRRMCFEFALPVNSVYAGNSRRSSRLGKTTNPSTMYENECGFLAASPVNATANVNVLGVAENTGHEMHDPLLLALFHNQFQQGATKKHKFIGTHFLTAQHVTNNDDFVSMLSACTTWGMNKRPVIVQLRRRYVVVDVSGPDSYDRATEEAMKRPEFVECRDMYDALLYWIHLMHTKYSDELLCSTVIKRCYDGLVPTLRQ